MPAEGQRSPDSDEPSSSDEFTLGVEAGPDGELSEGPVASIYDRNAVRRLTIHHEDGPLVSEIRLAGRDRRRPEPMIDLMDRPIPVDDAPAAEGEIAPPDDGEEVVISIERSEQPRTPRPTPDAAPDAPLV